MVFLHLLISLLCIRHVQAKAVFAHFMVTNSANYTATTWVEDMKLAQEAHIDAFALNMAFDDPVNSEALSAAFAAAESLGFKLFLPFDYAGNGPWPQDTVVGYIYQYDGLFSWAVWPWGNEDLTTYTDASYNQTLDGAPYMMPASPWFFTNLPGYNKNWLWRGDDLWYNRWQQIIYFQPIFVEIISWNDYGESHYIEPLRDDAMAAFSIGQAPYNNATDMPHDGWRKFLPFVINLYKTGTATVSREGITTWYRKSPAAACSTGGTSGNTASQLQLELPPTDVAQDRIFFTALLSSPAIVTVSIAGVPESLTWEYTPDGGIGLYHGSMPIGTRTGQVIVTLSRDGKAIAEVIGAPISNTCQNNIQNWNAWVGSSFSSDKISATPALNIADQKCIKGTGSYNFEGLCNFACSLGYCPISACTCQAMGKPPSLPAASEIRGYPIAGEDASYIGLCSFDCTYGYCPDTACGTVSAPLSTPTVSDFSPPSCISGSGEGNLAGLCNFACQYGFCPMNACSCHATGPLVLPPPAADVAGHAASGMDVTRYDDLCRFACSRGYCPTAACATLPAATAHPTTLATMPIITATGSLPTPSFDSSWFTASRSGPSMTMLKALSLLHKREGAVLIIVRSDRLISASDNSRRPNLASGV
ncbi:mutanase Pc12g07500 [Aspergillus lentulus]|uniref:Mutanase Pc12g07500 n=1 Tax=Aspergillus lentulus TaxID=293939 RepID=A0ABQ1B436_ASPLE|nr:mutanase Pc12g07500 [Aspergillus lentulus]